MQNDPFSPLELYQLKTDPQERTNLAATNNKMFNELAAALRQAYPARWRDAVAETSRDPISITTPL